MSKELCDKALRQRASSVKRKYLEDLRAARAKVIELKERAACAITEKYLEHACDEMMETIIKVRDQLMALDTEAAKTDSITFCIVVDKAGNMWLAQGNQAREALPDECIVFETGLYYSQLPHRAVWLADTGPIIGCTLDAPSDAWKVHLDIGCKTKPIIFGNLYTGEIAEKKSMFRQGIDKPLGPGASGGGVVR